MNKLKTNFFYLCIFLIIQIIGSALLLLTLLYPQSLKLYWFIILLCLFSYILIIKIILQIKHWYILNTQNIIHRQQIKFQEQHYLTSIKQIETINKIKKEIYQKINSFSNLNIKSKEDATKFTNHLILQYQNFFYTDYCNNKIIDAILYNKNLLAQTYDIKTSFHVIIPEKINLKSTEIMSLYANLLDNAIEANINTPKDNRFINLDSTISKNFLTIKMINSKPSSITVSIDKNLSTKPNDDDHGLGLNIIKEICKKYNGMFTVINNHTTVEFNITLCLPNKPM